MADDGSVEFRNVTFGYDPRHPVLKDVSFRVNSGQTVALVGPTGSGKSSAMALTHRLYDVQGGAVLVGENFVTLVVSQVSIETTEQLERGLAEPLEDTGFQRLKNDVGAPTLGNAKIT